MTGQISGHGKISQVGGIREKMVAAGNNSKAKVFIPVENIVEALDIEMNDTVVNTSGELKFYNSFFNLHYFNLSSPG